MKKIISIFFVFICFTSCSKTQNLEKSLNGFWKIHIDIQKKILPVVIFLEKKQDEISGYLVNATEKIPLHGSIKNDELFIEIGASYGVFNLILKDDSLSGKWSRSNKENFNITLKGERYNKDHLYKRFENKDNFLNITGNWKINFSDNEVASLGIFKQVGSRMQGSILSETGDYRFLDGYIEKDHVYLYGFDGTFSFLIECLINNDKMTGELFSGQSYKTQFSAMKDSNFKLQDANNLSKVKNSKPLKLELKDLEDRIVDLSDKSFERKIKIIQIFGSWCPNCIDETQFILNWKKENTDKLNHVEFIIAAFENFNEKKDAIKALTKLRDKLKIDYPILLADFKTTKTVLNYFPLDKLIAFPTMLILNSKNEIMKVHTGFSGPATGDFFKDFQKDFNRTIEKLIKSE